MSRALSVVVLAAVVFSAAAGAQSRTVALTFDDLPGSEAGELASTNLAILQALDRHHAPTTGFVIGDRVEAVPNGRSLLQSWIDHGHDLGNHTLSHRDLNALTVSDFAQEVTGGEAVFRPLLRAPRS